MPIISSILAWPSISISISLLSLSNWILCYVNYFETFSLISSSLIYSLNYLSKFFNQYFHISGWRSLLISYVKGSADTYIISLSFSRIRFIWLLVIYWVSCLLYVLYEEFSVDSSNFFCSFAKNIRRFPSLN